MPFTNLESYKHKCAKEIFKQWCNSEKWQVREDGHREVSTNFQNLCWTSNRSEHAWLEYPIVVSNNMDSVENNWDEIWDSDNKSDFVPTYEDCISRNLHPIAVIDIVLTCKGMPYYFIEICHTNPVSDEKLEKLKQLNLCRHGGCLIEIDAEWILRQTDIPSKIQIKRLLIDGEYDFVKTDYFSFKCEGISVNPILPNSKAIFNPMFTDMFIKYDINCSNNFSTEERLIIKKYNIQSLDDLLRCKNMSSYDKTRALECYRFVDTKFKLTGLEPFNGNTKIQFGKYLFVIRISFDRTIAFISSLGISNHSDYVTIQIGF